MPSSILRGVQDANCGTDVSGEFVREDNIEDQEGVFLGVDTQVIDVETCEPVPNTYVEIWRTLSANINPYSLAY